MEALAVSGASKTPECKPRIEGSLHISSLPERSRPKWIKGSWNFWQVYIHAHSLSPPPPPPPFLSLSLQCHFKNIVTLSLSFSLSLSLQCHFKNIVNQIETEFRNS